MTVWLVHYRWRNWAEDTFAFATKEKAEANIIANANEAASDDETFDNVSDALESLAASDHVVVFEELEVIE